MSPAVIAAAVAAAIGASFVFVALRHILRQMRLAETRNNAFRRCRKFVHSARATTRSKDQSERRRSVRYIRELKAICAEFGFRLEDVGTNQRQLDQIIFLTRDDILADPESVDPVAIKWRLNPDEPGTIGIEINDRPEELAPDIEIVIPLDLPALPAATSLELVEAAMARDAVPLPDIEEVMAALDRLVAESEVLTSGPRSGIETFRDSLPENHEFEELFGRLTLTRPNGHGSNGQANGAAHAAALDEGGN